MTIESIVMSVQLLATVILFVDLIYVLQQKSSEIKSHVIILLFSTLMMFIGYTFELQAKSLEEALIGTVVSYIGKPYIMLSSYMFIRTFFNHPIKKISFILMAIYGACFSILVYTNQYHYLYYSKVSFDITKICSPLIIERGILYNSYVYTCIVFFLACIFEIYKGYKTNAANKRYSLYMLAMVFSGIMGYAVYLTGITGTYDATMMGVFFGTIFLTLLFFRCRIFDALSLAKDQALADSSIGLLVIDQSNNVVFKNSAVDKFLVKDLTISQITRNEGRNNIIKTNNKTYSISTNQLVDNGRYLGKSFEISDVSDSHDYQERLENDVAQRTEQLESLQRQVIGSIASIVEARSVETGEHIIRTKEYVNITARSLKDMGFHTDILKETYIEMLSDCAPLHDIGKISVPDYILMKPGKLTAEEYESMKVHTKTGAKIIETTMKGVESEEYVALAEEVALYHHERWDGSGYPVGLKGEEIPLSARIMAIADTYDALVSERCYKPPYTKQQAIDIIRSESGTHFDPVVVLAFLAVI